MKPLVSVFVVVVLLTTRTAFALPGPAPHAHIAIAEYDYTTGQIVVSYDSVAQWYIWSVSGGLTGDAPMGLPANGGLITDTDSRLGETTFLLSSATNLNLGNVAAPGLPPEDLRVSWIVLGDPHGESFLDYINVPEPSSWLLAATSVLMLFGRRRRVSAA